VPVPVVLEFKICPPSSHLVSVSVRKHGSNVKGMRRRQKSRMENKGKEMNEEHNTEE
jgi:hypothetical protein